MVGLAHFGCFSPIDVKQVGTWLGRCTDGLDSGCSLITWGRNITMHREYYARSGYRVQTPTAHARAQLAKTICSLYSNAVHHAWPATLFKPVFAVARSCLGTIWRRALFPRCGGASVANARPCWHGGGRNMKEHRRHGLGCLSIVCVVSDGWIWPT